MTIQAFIYIALLFQGHPEPVGPLSNPDLWRVINIVVFALILVYILRNKIGIGKVFDSRAASIVKELEQAKRDKEDALRQLSEVEARLGRLDLELAEIRLEAEQEAAREAERIRQAAAADAEKIRQSAQREIEGAMKSAQRASRIRRRPRCPDGRGDHPEGDSPGRRFQDADQIHGGTGRGEEMSIVAIARRYAEALADVAIAHNQVEQMDAEVGAFAQLITGSRELHDVFASPVVSMEQKRSVLDAIIERTGVSAMIANLLRTMLSHYRLHDLTTVHEQFRRAINRRRGIALAEVTTAVPASQDAQQMLTRKLGELVGKQVQIQFKTDPALIGGAVTRLESVVYDGSIRTQLQIVKQRLKEGTL